MKKIVILGAGLSGLSTAFHIKERIKNFKEIVYEIYEKEKEVGGLCRTEFENGFFFDYSGHLLHLKNDYAKGLIESLIKDNLKSHKRNAWVYLKNRYIKYPFQANLNALPKEMRDECLSGFCKANSENKKKSNNEFHDFEEWILGRFGDGIAEYFMLPFNKKLWKNDLKEMTCEWVDEYIPVPDAEEITKGVSREQKKEYGYNITFQYPKTGGIQALPDTFAKEVKKVNFGMEATELDLQKKVARFSNGEKIQYDILISTIPLKELVKKIVSPPYRVKRAGDNLRYNSVLIINLGLKRNNSSMHWIYVPEDKYPFYRFGYFSNFSENMAPKGKSSIYCEVSYGGGEKIDQEKIYRESIDSLIDIGIIRDKSEIIERKILDIEYAYVIYNKEYKVLTKEIHSFLKSHDIFSIGRYGKWEYSSMEDAILQGREVVNWIINGFQDQ